MSEKAETKKLKSANMLSGIKAAEKTLAREDLKRLEDLPLDHPLRATIEQEKARIGGDLSDLPPGHPLLRELEAARQRFETVQAQETDQMQDKATKVRRARRVQEARQAVESRKEEDEKKAKRKVAAVEVGQKAVKIGQQVEELLAMIMDKTEDIAIDGHSKVQLARMTRFMQAVRTGMAECNNTMKRIS